MAHPTKTTILSILGTAAIAAGTASAQVAPPPTDAPKEDPVYTPPPAPRQAGLPKMNAPETTGRTTNVAPNIPFRSLVERDENGAIIPITRPIELAALANNPTVGDAMREKVMPIVHRRHLNVEERVLANLDLFLAFEQGMLDQLEGQDIQQLALMSRSLKPLSEDGDIANDLRNAGVFSGTQLTVNERISGEYKKALSDEVKLIHGQDMGALFRNIFEVELIEPRFAYRLMVAELMRHPGAIEKAGISGAERIRALTAAGWPDDGQSRAQAVERLTAALSNLSVDDHRALLTASRSMRANPNAAPLPEIPLRLDDSGASSKVESNIRVKHLNAEEAAVEIQRQRERSRNRGTGG